MDVIKKAYLQEEERENSEVSPREVGHNIYILALQVPARPHGPTPHGHAPQPPPRRPRPVTLRCPLAQLSRHNKQLQHLLKPVKRIQEEEAEGISSMVGPGTRLGVGRDLDRGVAGLEMGWASIWGAGWELRAGLWPEAGDEGRAEA